MTIFSSAQICGTSSPVKVYRINGGDDVFITVGEQANSVTLTVPTLRQMVDAVAAFEASEAAEVAA